MKRIAITITLDCRDDVPLHVIWWMEQNLAEHARLEFGADFDPELFLDGDYEGPPLLETGDIATTIAVR